MTLRNILLAIVATAVSLAFPSTGECQGKKRLQTLPSPLVVPELVPNRDVSASKTVFPSRLIQLYDTISITFIGDVMQHGKQLKDALAEGADPDLAESYKYDYTFKYIEARLQKSDLAVANMEFPVGLTPYSGYPLFSAPETIIHQAQKSGIDLFLLANNHLFDKGKRGFLSTLSAYERAGAKYTGAYRDPEQQSKENPVLYNIRGIRVAFINFTYGTNGMPVPEPCTINLMDSTYVKKNIATAQEWGADMIICLPHWGEEYMLTPSVHQKRWAEMMFREGADIIIGGHPHVPQSAEYSSSKALFYSLGNYISNQTTPDYTQLEMMVTIHIVKNSYTGETSLLPPDIEYLWCFKKGEFAPHYTVVPVEDIVGKKYQVHDSFQRSRMERTYRSFLEKGLVKENESLK